MAISRYKALRTCRVTPAWDALSAGRDLQAVKEMNKAVAIGAAIALTLTSNLAQAAEGDKNFSLGGSLYWIDIDATNLITMDFTGGSLVGTAAFNENVAVRGSIYSTTSDLYDEVELGGYDAQVLLGGNLNREGFKYYLALGVFSESLEDGDESIDFSGAQIGAGFGYNWPQVALDYTINLRSADDYVDFVEDSGMMQRAGVRRSEVSATSTSLALSFRF